MIRNRYVTLVWVAFIAIADLCTSASADMLCGHFLPERAYTSNSGPGGIYAFDGVVDSYWGANDWVGWIAVDFGRNVELTTAELVVIGQTSNRTVTIYATQAPYVAGDPATWTDTQTRTMYGTFNCTFPAGTIARHVRIDEVSNDGGSWVAWGEIRLYAKSGTVSGVVRSSGPGNPGVAGVTIKNGNYSTLTDANGNYTLPLPSGAVDLSASKLGFVTATTSIQLDPDESETVNFTLTPTPTGTISGTVWELLDGVQSEHPVAGATVATADYAFTATTDAAGNYSLTLNSGAQTVFATANNYTIDTKSITVPESGSLSQDFAIASTAAGAVGGTVYADLPGGQVALAGADVWIFDHSWTGTPTQATAVSVHTTTDADGRYWARMPAGGPFCICVVAPGCKTGWNEFAIAVAQEHVDDLLLEPGVVVSQNLLTSAYSANGQSLPVTNAFDGNVLGSYWQSDSGAWDGWVEVDLGRTIDLSSIFLLAPRMAASRTIKVWVTDSPIGSSDPSAIPVAAEVAGAYDPAVPVELDLSGKAGRYVHVFQGNEYGWARWLEVQVMAAACYITGTVTSSEAGNLPIAGAVVQTSNGSAKTVTDENGNYTLTVAPGTNVIVANLAGYGGGSASVTTVAGQTVDQDFVLSPVDSGTVIGRVHDTFPGEAGIPGATVQTADGFFSTVTDGEGNYQLQVPAGTVNLVASKDGYTSATATIEVPAYEFVGADFALTSVSDGFLVGTVVANAPGMPPIAGAMVWVSAWIDPMALVHTAVYGVQTDAEGRFAVRVPAGQYLAASGMDGYTFATAIATVSAGQVIDCGKLKMLATGGKLAVTGATNNGETWIHMPAGAFDSNLSLESFWQSRGVTGWIQADLGSSQALGSMSMIVWGYQGKRTAEVWYSDSPMEGDPSAATLAGVISGISSPAEVVNFWFPAGAAGRYVMINCTEEPNDYPGFIDIAICAPGSMAATPFASLADAKGQVDGTLVGLTEAQVVTVASGTFTDNTIYIEDTGRTTALKIVPSGGLAEMALGDRVTLTGVLGTDANGERYLYVISIDSSAGGADLKPYGVINRGLDSLPWGMLRCIWGEITYKDDTVAYVDDGSGVSDGSGHLGVKLDLAGLAMPLPWVPDEGMFVRVTGVVSSGTQNTLRLRNGDDIFAY